MTVGTEPLRDITAEDLLKRLSDLQNYPHDALAPYEEYKLDEKTYYFTPGGSERERSLRPTQVGVWALLVVGL